MDQPDANSIVAMLQQRLASWTTFVVAGPLHVDRSEDRHLIERALSFRRDYNLRRAPHLESAEQRRLEHQLEFDARSHHFVALAGEHVVAAIRLTPAPFEVSVLLPELIREELAGYLEFARLCVADHLPSRLQIEATSQVVVTSGVWFLAQRSHAGILALARPETGSFMLKVGLGCEHSGLTIAGRGPDYMLMRGTYRSILEHNWRVSHRRQSRSPWLFTRHVP